MNEEELAAHNKKKEAVAAKSAGNDFYKNKDFASALSKYDEAISLDPTNMTFISNKAAVYFTKKEYDNCISACEEALEVGKVSCHSALATFPSREPWFQKV